jgi:hypothetical protein
VTRCGCDAANALFLPEEVRAFRARYAAGGVTIRELASEAHCGYTTMQKLLSREHYPETALPLTRWGIKRYPDDGTAI